MTSVLKETPSIRYSYDDYIMELKGKLQTAHEVARQKLISSKVRSKDTEQTRIEIGQNVLLYEETVRRGRSRKLSPHYNGPTCKQAKAVLLGKSKQVRGKGRKGRPNVGKYSPNKL